MTNTITYDFIFVDGSSYLFRAYHAMPPLSTAEGEPSGAIFGVINMLRRLQHDYPTTPIIVVFDSKGKTTRHQLYPDYKANRPPMAEELAVQIPPCHEIIKALGMPLIVNPGIEADDIIGTLVTQAQAVQKKSLVVTGDKDLAQLVNSDVTLLNTMNNTQLDEAGVLDKFGVPADRIVDYLALIGDKVDNIPGVPKVGPKTAVKWLTHYGDLQGVIDHADDISGKVGESLREHLSLLPLSKQLVTLDCDIDLGVNITELDTKEADKDALKALFKHYEFSRWYKELEDDSVPEDNTNYEAIQDEAQLTHWLKRLSSKEAFAFDLETTSLDPIEAVIVGIAIACDAGQAAYIPLAHDDPDFSTELTLDKVLDRFKPLLENTAYLKIGQNIKYDMSVLAKYDVSIHNLQDTMLMSYVLNSVATRHDMDSLAEKYLSRKTISFEDVAGRGKKQLRFDQVPVAKATQYAAEDADVTLQLYDVLMPQLETMLKKLLAEIDLPLIPVLSRMERQGVCVDKQLLEEQSQVLAVELEQLEKEAYGIVGRTFNMASPKQLQAILYEELKLPVLKKTPGGQPSTAEAVLQELAYDYPLPQIMLEHRRLSKLKTTYTDKLPLQINSVTDRIHTSYHQAVTATGRLSSSDPNLQNIPIRSQQGRQIRQAFVAPLGSVIVAADYSQIELRIMAHLSQDQGLMSAFAAGQDVHRATAAEVFSKHEDQVTDEERRRAKAINFGLIYGMSAFGLAKQLSISRQEAQDYVDIYFERYPGVLQYMDRTREQAKEQGYVETLFGRRLYLPDIQSRQVMKQKAAERTAINAPMQGTAADIIKKAMIACDAWLQETPSTGSMIMQVHDELVFEIKQETLDQACDRIREHMQQAASLAVPLIVDMGTGSSWEQAH